MTTYGYARVSTKSQNIGVQTERLIAAGVEKGNIFTDVGVSGKRAQRPGLDGLLAVLEAGDEVVIVKLDRIGRSMIHTAQLAEHFRANGIALRSLNDGVNLSTKEGRMMFNLLATFAEYERDLIVERTQAGLEHAREQGRSGGRPRKMTPKFARLIKTLVDSGYTPAEIAEDRGVSRATAYRYIADANEVLSTQA